MSNQDSNRLDQHLYALRSEIDDIDLQVSTLLARRHELVVEIGKRKQSLGAQVHDDKREKFVLDRVAAQGGSSGEADFIRKVYDRILQLSRNAQSKIPED
jgi:3-deoxy-7-phosphoheptulonate synthase/chorismate mutase